MGIQTEDTYIQKFGSYMRMKREEKKITLRTFAKEIGITAAYLSDIEKGNRAAPKSKLAEICDRLVLTTEERAQFYDLAALTCGNHYEDINPYLSSNGIARAALRKARDSGIPDSWWQEVVKQIENYSESDSDE